MSRHRLWRIEIIIEFGISDDSRTSFEHLRIEANGTFEKPYTRRYLVEKIYCGVDGADFSFWPTFNIAVNMIPRCHRSAYVDNACEQSLISPRHDLMSRNAIDMTATGHERNQTRTVCLLTTI